MRGTVGPILPKPLCIRIVMANVLIWIVMMMMMMMVTTDTCLHNLTSPQRISMPRSTSGVNKVRTKIDKETKKTIQRLHQTDISMKELNLSIIRGSSSEEAKKIWLKNCKV